MNPYWMLLLVFLVNLFVMLDGQMSNDEGIWNYIGRVWYENGMPPYVGTVENKTPGIFELFAVSHMLFGVNFYFVRLLGVLAVSFSALTLFCIGRKLHSPSAGIFSMAVFGLTMAWGALEGPHMSQTETFMNLFSILAFFCVIRGAEGGAWKGWALASGMCMGLAIAFKQIAIATAAGLIVFMPVYAARKVGRRDLCAGILLAALGICVSTVASYVPLLISGVSLRDYFEGAWMILLNEGSHTPTVRHLRELVRVFTNSKLALFYPILFLFFLQRSLGRQRFFMGLLVWLSFDFVGTNASGYYFGHQIKQLIPSLSLILGIVLSNFLDVYATDSTLRPKYTSMVLVSLVVLVFPYDTFINNAYHMVHFDRTKVVAREVGTWLKGHTGSGDYVYVAIGGGNPILSYSDRLSPSRYFNTLFVTSPREREILLSDMESKSPLYIVRSRKDPFSKNVGKNIERYISRHYTLLFSHYEYDVLKRKTVN